MEYSYAQMAESHAKSIEDARDGKTAIGKARTAIPTGMLLMGTALLGVGIFELFGRSGRHVK